MNKYVKKMSGASLGSMLLVLSIALLAVGCNAGKNQPARFENPEANTQVLATPTPEAKQEYIKYQGVEGANALELLKQKQQVTVKTYAGIGDFVDGINGLQNDSGHFWSFYVNGAQATVGAGSYTTKATDIIEWKFEAIQ